MSIAQPFANKLVNLRSITESTLRRDKSLVYLIVDEVWKMFLPAIRAASPPEHMPNPAPTGLRLPMVTQLLKLSIHRRGYDR